MNNYRFLLLLVLMLLNGCQKEVIVYYEIPKEAPTPESTGLPQGHPSVSGESETVARATASGAVSALIWERPESWMTGGKSSMRLASYTIEGHDKSTLDVSITRFPGDVGGLFSNVNRWRGQLGLDRFTDPSELEPLVFAFETENFVFQWVGLENNVSPPKRMEVAILELNGFTWFIKIMGSREMVMAEHEHFEAFVRSIQQGPGN